MEHFYIKFGDASRIDFWDIIWKKQTDKLRWKPTPATAVGVVKGQGLQRTTENRNGWIQPQLVTGWIFSYVLDSPERLSVSLQSWLRACRDGRGLGLETHQRLVLVSSQSRLFASRAQDVILPKLVWIKGTDFLSSFEQGVYAWSRLHVIAPYELILCIIIIIIIIIITIIIINGRKNNVTTAIIITCWPSPILTSRWRLSAYKRLVSVSSRSRDLTSRAHRCMYENEKLFHAERISVYRGRIPCHTRNSGLRTKCRSCVEILATSHSILVKVVVIQLLLLIVCRLIATTFLAAVSELFPLYSVYYISIILIQFRLCYVVLCWFWLIIMCL